MLDEEIAERGGKQKEMYRGDKGILWNCICGDKKRKKLKLKIENNSNRWRVCPILIDNLSIKLIDIENETDDHDDHYDHDDNDFYKVNYANDNEVNGDDYNNHSNNDDDCNNSL